MTTRLDEIERDARENYATWCEDVLALVAVARAAEPALEALDGLNEWLSSAILLTEETPEKKAAENLRAALAPLLASKEG